MDYQLAHFNMIEQQIRPWDVLDQRVLDVLASTPRHFFVPQNYTALAYSETLIPLTAQATMLEPKVVARFLQAVNPQTHEKALEIGTGSGYLTCMLAQLCASVTSVEIDDELRQQASARLQEMGVCNVQCHQGDAKDDWADGQRYHVIIMTGAVTSIPDSYRHKLEVGGRLVAIVGEDPAMQVMLITRTENNQWVEEILFETSAPYLAGTKATEKFYF
jgi:protein-L-isoaspartate(D-aspartate) O-methyltransferase